jgi:small subunit ribosomal protein S3Ae
MAPKSKTKAKATRVKQKKWTPIYAPKAFNEQILGESPVTDTTLLLGRVISVSLMDITGDPNKQSTYLKFKITEQKGSGVGTEIVGYNILLSASKRKISRAGNKITHSFVCKTADNRVVRVKPLVFTKAYVKGSISKAVRKIVEETLVKEISKRDFTTCIIDIIMNKLQISVKEASKKVYPLRMCDVRVFEIEKDSRLKKARISTVEDAPVEEKAPEDETPVLTAEESEEKKEEVGEQ